MSRRKRGKRDDHEDGGPGAGTSGADVSEQDELIEKLAALSHEQWAGWTRWMMDMWGAYHESGELYRSRWKRQMLTPYAELSEAEKESDRIEARKMLAVVGAQAKADAATIAELREVLRRLCSTNGAIIGYVNKDDILIARDLLHRTEERAAAHEEGT
jgi:hypothetical protein